MAGFYSTPVVSRRCVVVVAILLSLLCAGCMDNVWQGEVGSINGRPIKLAHVAALRNSLYFEMASSPMPELEAMRKQYGEAFTTLMAVELVKQHLEKKKMAVTEDELASEETGIRAGYPAGAFEQILLREAIDIESWRFLLRNHLSVQRFLDTVLKPGIVISPEEASAYLQSNPVERTRPPWAYFFLISGKHIEQVRTCGKELDEVGDPVSSQRNHPEVFIRTVRMDIKRLDPRLAEKATALRPGDLSQIFELDEEFHQILLIEILPEREADETEIYTQVEQILMDRKLQTAYNDWIIKRLKKSKIKISQQLLPNAQ